MPLGLKLKQTDATFMESMQTCWFQLVLTDLQANLWAVCELVEWVSSSYSIIWLGWLVLYHCVQTLQGLCFLCRCRTPKCYLLLMHLVLVSDEGLEAGWRRSPCGRLYSDSRLNCNVEIWSLLCQKRWHLIQEEQPTYLVYCIYRCEKKVVRIQRNYIDWFCRTSSARRLSRQEIQPHTHTNHSKPNSHYLHLLRVLHSTDTHPGQRPASGEIHTSKESTTRTPQTHTHTATLATYLCYITNATAYPSTGRSALCSATGGDASPELFYCLCVSVTIYFLQLQDMRTCPRGWWHKGLILNDLRVSWRCKLRFSAFFPTWHLTIHEGEFGQKICFSK